MLLVLVCAVARADDPVARLKAGDKTAVADVAAARAGADRAHALATAQALAGAGPAAAPLVADLRECLLDDDVELRVAAARALGAVGEAAAPALPDLVRLTGSEATADVALEALARIGPPALSFFANRVKDASRRRATTVSSRPSTRAHCRISTPPSDETRAPPSATRSHNSAAWPVSAGHSRPRGASARSSASPSVSCGTGADRTSGRSFWARTGGPRARSRSRSRIAGRSFRKRREEEVHVVLVPEQRFPAAHATGACARFCRVHREHRRHGLAARRPGGESSARSAAPTAADARCGLCAGARLRAMGGNADTLLLLGLLVVGGLTAALAAARLGLPRVA